MANSVAGTVSPLGVAGGHLSADIEGGTAPWVEGGELTTSVSNSTVTDVWGLFIYSEITGTSSVTNRYGIQIDAPVGTTTGTDFGIYVNANVSNHSRPEGSWR